MLFRSVGQHTLILASKPGPTYLHEPANEAVRTIFVSPFVHHEMVVDVADMSEMSIDHAWTGRSG